MHKALTGIALTLAGLVPAPAHAAPAPTYAPHLTASMAGTEARLGEAITVPPTVSEHMASSLAELGLDDTTQPVFRGTALLTCSSDADCDLARTAPGVS